MRACVRACNKKLIAVVLICCSIYLGLGGTDLSLWFGIGIGRFGGFRFGIGIFGLGSFRLGFVFGLGRFGLAWSWAWTWVVRAWA